MPTRLRGTYPIAVAVALLGLCPNLVLSTGLLPLTPVSRATSAPRRRGCRSRAA